MSSVFQTQNWTLHVANQSDLITDLNYINDNDFNWDLIGDPFFLFSSFSGISNDPFAGINYTLVLAPGADIKLTSALPNLTLQNGATYDWQLGKTGYDTVNVGSNAGSAPLHISAVGNANHGQVSLQTNVNGAGQTVTEVVFLPDPDFYGTASFNYTVTDPYGLSSTATASFITRADSNTSGMNASPLRNRSPITSIAASNPRCRISSAFTPRSRSPSR